MNFYEILKTKKLGRGSPDYWTQLFAEHVGGTGEWRIAELTGTLPMTFRSNGTALINYRIYGTADGAGVQTENEFDVTIEIGGWQGITGIPPTKYGNNTRLRCKTMFSAPSIDTYTFAVFPSSYKISVMKCDSTGNVILDTGWSTNNYHMLTNLEKCVFVIRNASGTNISPSDIEGVCIVKGSTPPETYIPHGYKLPMQVKQRTKNLLDITGYNRTHYGVRWYEDNGQLKASGTYTDSAAHTWPRFYVELSAGTYTLSGSPDFEQSNVGVQIGKCTDNQGSDYSSLGYDKGTGYTFTLQADSWVSIRVYTASSLYQQTVDLTLPLMLRKANTTPDFEPYYNIKQADIYVGDSKLLSDDYIDYESGKIVRNGTPTDSPLPFPAIEPYKDTNTLDSTETVGEVTIKGQIKPQS